MLAAAQPWDVKKIMGDYTYHLVSQIYPLVADRLTEKLLEMDNPQLLVLFDSEVDLRRQLDRVMTAGTPPAGTGGGDHGNAPPAPDITLELGAAGRERKIKEDAVTWARKQQEEWDAQKRVQAAQAASAKPAPAAGTLGGGTYGSGSSGGTEMAAAGPPAPPCSQVRRKGGCGGRATPVAPGQMLFVSYNRQMEADAQHQKL